MFANVPERVHILHERGDTWPTCRLALDGCHRVHVLTTFSMHFALSRRRTARHAQPQTLRYEKFERFTMRVLTLARIPVLPSCNYPYSDSLYAVKISRPTPHRRRVPGAYPVARLSQ